MVGSPAEVEVPRVLASCLGVVLLLCFLANVVVLVVLVVVAVVVVVVVVLVLVIVIVVVAA